MNLIGRCAFAILALSVTVACGGSKPAATTTAQPAAKAAAVATGGQIGVPECDEFLTKYEACIQSKVPESMRATFAQSMAQARDGYKQAAAVPAAKATLAASCKQALDATKQAMSAYTCQW
jgi:hypothetical protein